MTFIEFKTDLGNPIIVNLDSIDAVMKSTEGRATIIIKGVMLRLAEEYTMVRNSIYNTLHFRGE